MRIASLLHRAPRDRSKPRRPLFRPTTIAERHQPAVLWCEERQALVAGTQVERVCSWDFALGAPLVLLETTFEPSDEVLLDCASV